eukprot:1048919-Amphidinium_carterae.1
MSSQILGFRRLEYSRKATDRHVKSAHSLAIDMARQLNVQVQSRCASKVANEERACMAFDTQ